MHNLNDLSIFLYCLQIYRYIVFYIGIKHFDHVSLRIYYDFDGICDLFVLWPGIQVARPAYLEMQGEVKIRQKQLSGIEY